MFAHLTLAVRDRIIHELREFWADDPRYPMLSNNIQGKYSFEERPQFGMVIRTGGASNIVLSPDNFIGTVLSTVSLARLKEFKPYGSVEWAKEDSMSSTNTPGVYVIKIFDDPSANVKGHSFHAYAHRYERRIEASPMVIGREIHLLDAPLEGSLRLIEYPSMRLVRKAEYELNNETGVVTLAEDLPSGFKIEARYTVDSGQEGPFTVKPAQAYNNIVKGAILAFGRKIREGDQQVVIVSETPEIVSEEYGGRWDVSVDVELIARDPHSQADICDRTTVWIWSSLRKKLTEIGVDISEVNLGGEAEEVYDENGDDYFYTGSISFTAQTNWFVHDPVVIPIYYVSKEGIVPFEIAPISDMVSGVGTEVVVPTIL